MYRKNFWTLDQIRIRQATSLLLFQLVAHVFKGTQKKHIKIILPRWAKRKTPRRRDLSGLTLLYSITGALRAMTGII